MFALFHLIALITGTVFVVHWWLPVLSFVVYIHYFLIIFHIIIGHVGFEGERQSCSPNVMIVWLEKFTKLDN